MTMKVKTNYHQLLVDLAKGQSLVLDQQFNRVGSSRNTIGIYAIYKAYKARMVATKSITERKQLAKELKQALVNFSRNTYNVCVSSALNFVEGSNNIYKLAISEGAFQVNSIDPSGNLISIKDSKFNDFWSVYELSFNSQIAALALVDYNTDSIDQLLNESDTAKNFTTMLSKIMSIHTDQDTKLANTAWLKQVIAVINHRTTECCRVANGQFVFWEQKFHLTGLPHYNSEMFTTPFHNWCRSVCILIPLSMYDRAVTTSLIGV